MRLLTAQQVRDLDRQAIEDYGVSGLVLMENAGRGACDWIRPRLPAPSAAAPLFCIAGAGNNGGDAYVIARHLLNAGYDVRTLLCVPRDKIRGDADANLTILEKMQAPIFSTCQESEWKKHLPALQQCEAIIDGLLGTGLGRDVDGWFLDVLQQLNAIEGPLKVALDVPSGLDANSGHPRPVCFHAELTVTFAAAKVGLLAPSAEPWVGQLEVIDIGLPSVLLEQTEAVCETLEAEQIQSWVPQRGFNSHKGTFGHLLVLAGSRGKAGAAQLTATAALRSGVGLCTLLTDPDIAPRLEGTIPEIMCEALPVIPVSQWSSEPSWWLSLQFFLERKSALVMGPGWSQSPARGLLLQKLLEEVELPIVLDADGLNLLAGNLEWLQARKAPTILTPHPGEMSRLTGRGTGAIQRNRLSIASDFAQQHGVTLVLKGARTVIASPQGRCWLNLTGHAGLATGGSGDVLAGILGALLAQGLHPDAAACVGVYLHGLAADSLLNTHGAAGLMASDLIQALPALLRDWEQTTHHGRGG